MGFRFRRSIRIAKGVKLNVSKSGFGISAGVPGARISAGPAGVRATAGIPGTGLSWSQNLAFGSRGNTQGSRMTKTEIVDALCNRNDVIGEVTRTLRSQMPELISLSKDAGKTHGWPIEIHLAISDLGQNGTGVNLKIFTPGASRDFSPSDFKYSIATLTQRQSSDSLIVSLLDNMQDLRPSDGNNPGTTANIGIQSGCCCAIPAALVVIVVILLLLF